MGARQVNQMQSAKMGTVALIVTNEAQPSLIETFSDDHEIALFEAALQTDEPRPLEIVYDMRSQRSREDEEFGDYVEELLSQSFVRKEIQEHGLQWLKSKIKIEQFQKSEKEATKVIAGYAFKLFEADRNRTEFTLAGPSAKVHIRVFVVAKEKAALTSKAA